VLDTQSMTWWAPAALKGQTIAHANEEGTAMKHGMKELKHLYNHGACRATNSSSICVFGGFDGRQSVMDFFVLGIDIKIDD